MSLQHLLLIWNGTLAGQESIVGPLGGGDQVLIKSVNRSGLRPDLIIPKTATSFITSHREFFLTARSFGWGIWGLVALFLIRTIQGIVFAVRLRPRNYDLALATSPFLTELGPLLFCRARRKGTIVYHVIPERRAVNWATRIRFWLARVENRVSMRLLDRACDFIITGNDYAKSQFEKMFPGKKVLVLHAGFNTREVDQHPTPPKNYRQACFLGRLTSQKGIFDLLAIMEQINRAVPDFRLIIMGTGPEQQALVKAIADRHVTSIAIKGFVTDEEKYAILKGSGFFFFPSYEEGWGIALAEALYCGCVAVCYELPHYRSIFGEFPVYAELGNGRQFAEKFLESQGRRATDEQVAFMRQYDDEAVVKDLVRKLEALAGGGAV